MSLLSFYQYLLYHFYSGDGFLPEMMEAKGKASREGDIKDAEWQAEVWVLVSSPGD